jgi:hypothetical protein
MNYRSLKYFKSSSHQTAEFDFFAHFFGIIFFIVMLAKVLFDNSYFVPEVKNDNSTYDEVVEREEVKEYWRIQKETLSSCNATYQLLTKTVTKPDHY